MCARDKLCFHHWNTCWNIMCLFNKCWVTPTSVFSAQSLRQSKLRQSHCLMLALTEWHKCVLTASCGCGEYAARTQVTLLSSDSMGASVGAQCERSGPYKVLDNDSDCVMNGNYRNEPKILESSCWRFAESCLNFNILDGWEQKCALKLNFTLKFYF